MKYIIHNNIKYYHENDKIVKAVNSKGDVAYYKDRQFHKDNDLPAVELANDNKFGNKNGKFIKST